MDDGTSISPSYDALTPPPPPPPPPAPSRRRPLLGRRGATAALAGGLVAGGMAGGYMIAQAATPSPSASGSAPSISAPAEPGHPGGDCGPGGVSGPGRTEDQQVVAGALGLTTAQLQTEETAGKTIAAIATEHHVAVSKVVGALVASENAEIDKIVSSGQLTAAQGAQMKAMTTQRVTDEVNGVHPASRPPDRPSN